MAKKLTQYEIECIGRQLDKAIIVPLNAENDRIIEQAPDNPEIVKDIKKLASIIESINVLEEEVDRFEEKRDEILKKYDGNNYVSRRDAIGYLNHQHQIYKKAQSKLLPVPTYMEIRDLVILNSNLDLQEIIKVVTEKFALNEN